MRSWNDILKDPRIDDSGDYDYLAEELPQDTIKRESGCRCDVCGRENTRALVQTHYFYCYDGWDSCSYAECWRCRLKSWLYSKKYKLKRSWKRHKNYIGFIIALKPWKRNGVTIKEKIKLARELAFKKGDK